MRSLILALLAVVLCAGCATTGTTAGDGVNDPFERANRAIFRFNLAADRAILRPVATGYHNITPDPLERSISKFFTNLSSPVVIVGDLLQGKFKQAGSDTARFLVNSTIGILGFLDPATHMGLEYHDEDLGQAFGRWGIGEGPYLMVPILGPYSMRDGIARVLELPLEPIRYIEDTGARNSAIVLYSIDKRVALLPGDEALESAFDPYLFLRDAYLQRREYLLYDGNPPLPEDDFGDDYSEEDFLSGE